MDYDNNGKVILNKEKYAVNHTKEWKAELDSAIKEANQVKETKQAKRFILTGIRKESEAKKQDLYRQEPYFAKNVIYFTLIYELEK